MKLKEFKATLDTHGIVLVDILYGLYYDLFKGTETSSTIDDIGFYTREIYKDYGELVADAFLQTEEIQELLASSRK